jgi:Fe-S-cluster containining protein
MPNISSPTWLALAQGRQCGSCYACCQWLGVEELRKHTGTSCHHLSGTDDGAKRCSIYAKRPSACAAYKCMWLEGYAPNELKPELSGILLTTYASDTNKMGAVTAMVFDHAKAEPYIDALIKEILGLGLELRLVNYKTKRVLFFTNGNIYDAKLLPTRSYESLDFEANSKPIGHYLSIDLPQTEGNTR